MVYNANIDASSLKKKIDSLKESIGKFAEKFTTGMVDTDGKGNMETVKASVNKQKESCEAIIKRIESIEKCVNSFEPPRRY